MSANKQIEEIKKLIKDMKVNDLLELVKELSEHFEIDLSNVSSVSSSKSESINDEDEDSTKGKLKSLYLKKIPSDIKNKYSVMKLISVILSINLIKAKTEMENLPLLLGENLTDDEINKIKEQFKGIEDVILDTKSN